MQQSFELSQLLAFVKVVETNSFTSAAEILNLPKSQISRRVAALEAGLGSRLLQRSTRSLTLTDAGRLFYAHCMRILAEVSHAEQAITALQGQPRGILRFTMPDELGLELMGRRKLLCQFLQRYPEIEVMAEFSARLVNLLEEGYDLALRATMGDLQDSSLAARKLATMRRALFASPAYLNHYAEPITPQDLSQHRCLLHPILGKSHWQLTQNEKTIDIPVHGSLCSNNLNLLKEVALEGFGIANLPYSLCVDEVQQGQLKIILNQYAPPNDELYALYPSRHYLSPKVKVFLDFLTDALREI